MPLLFFLLLLTQHVVLGKITDAEVMFDDRLLVPLDEPYGGYSPSFPSHRPSHLTPSPLSQALDRVAQ